MAEKPNLLIIADYNRKDYVDLFSACRGLFNFYFLYHTSFRQEKSDYYKTYGKAIYWQDYRDIFALLDAVKPAKVIFFYIKTYNQIVLNLACKSAGVRTFQLEHGLRADYVAGVVDATGSREKGTLSDITKKIARSICDAPSRIKNRLFLLNSIRRLPKGDAAYAKEYIKTRKRYNYSETIRRMPAAGRTPDFYIAFSRNIYHIIKKEDDLPDNKAVDYIGVPYFDHFARIKAAEPVKALLFIDQPLSEKGLLGWRSSDKAAFAKQLAIVCQKANFKLLVKPHPLQDLSVWHLLSRSLPVQLISDAEVTALAPALRLVLGFYSTYLLPFAAMDHMAVITYENHPAGEFLISGMLTEAGVAKAIFDLQELCELLPAIGELHRQQQYQKKKFIEEWLYKFDGKSGERLKDVLLTSH